MKSEEIRDFEKHPLPSVEIDARPVIAFWLREIAAQFAEQNERTDELRERLDTQISALAHLQETMQSLGEVVKPEKKKPRGTHHR